MAACWVPDMENTTGLFKLTVLGAVAVAFVMSLPKTRLLLEAGFTTSEGASVAWDLVILLIVIIGWVG